MNTDLSAQVMAMNSSKLQSSLQIAVFKKTNDLQNQVLDTLMQTALSAPPPGQGIRLDKLV